MNQLKSYLESQKDFWDLFAVTETAEKKGRAEGMAEGMAKGRAEGMAEGMAKGREEGREEGRAEGMAEVFRTMYRKGMSVEQIAEMTSTDMEEVRMAVSADR
ncbi:MAG: hypothetical protein PUF27_05515 [Bacteroidales bacterium]|nr:hypothetical protein [Bacteroidales bacterium]MDD6555061.1 hypothetical protein [Bacteroidales bacterium]MDD6774063.1 hypothetical protein [Bacteroidales bacterium]